MSGSLAPPAPATAAGRSPFGIPYGFTERHTFPRYIENRHLLTFGPTRSGKGATVIVPALLLVPHSVLCIDPKGQNAAITARRRGAPLSAGGLGQDVHLLNPFDELGLGTSRLNPLARLRIDQRNVVADVRSMADAMIVPGKDAHWTDSALDLLTTLLLYLVATKPGTATLMDMRRLLTLPAPLFVKKIREMVAMREYPFICQPAARFGVEDSREIASIISTAQTQTFFLDDPNIAEVLSANDFDLAQLKEKPTTVYVILPSKYVVTYARFFRLLLTSALDQLTSKPGGYRTLVICDEFACLQNLSAVSRAFGFAAGYNVQVWPFLQDLPQLQDIYGDRWESFMANAGIVQAFTSSDLTTADYLLRRAGQSEHVSRSLTKNEVSKKQAEGGFSGYTQSFTKEMRPLIPHEVSMSMHSSRQLVFFSGFHSVRLEGRLEYWRNPRLAGLYDPDPFHV